jgi:hypothetical protein
MKKIVKMVRYEECDVDKKNLFEVNLQNFHPDAKQKDLRAHEKDSWVACVQTRFLFASDFDCKEINDLITKFYTLEVGERETEETAYLLGFAVNSSHQLCKTLLKLEGRIRGHDYLKLELNDYSPQHYQEEFV